MKCRAMQALHLLALEPIAETIADRNSYGFRPQRSTADAAAQCFGVLSRKVSAEWVLEGDIQGCFDNISHDWMIANLPMDKVILRKWLKAGYVYQTKLFPQSFRNTARRYYLPGAGQHDLGRTGNDAGEEVL
ncbi:reverse transcriptase domain-containing protein [Acinetobacter haemolyticus]|uniref:reverse transcriptase domain-containing protein n=1 Tax=Acinetobacter haemolyticus TaxID=29430 RepID=UPI0031F4591A